MFKKIVDLYKKYEEVIMYLVFGVLTTVVNFVVYFIAIHILGDSDLSKTISNALAWFFSVLFAFFTNKIFVFKHKSENAKDFILEAFKLIRDLKDKDTYVLLQSDLPDLYKEKN